MQQGRRAEEGLTAPSCSMRMMGSRRHRSEPSGSTVTKSGLLPRPLGPAPSPLWRLALSSTEGRRCPHARCCHGCIACCIL
jgi:hypothetical protein